VTTKPNRPAAGQEPLSDRVISEVRQRIISQSLRADQPFTEGDIATLLGVSKSPVREALALLRRQGWVHVLPRSGYRVAQLTLHDAQNLMTVRLGLEPEAAAAAARRGRRWPDQLSALRSYARRPHRTPKNSDPVTEHYRFHKRIAVLSGNAELERILSETFLKLQRYDQLESLADGTPELASDHAALAEAIAEHDAERARSLAVEHVTAARDALIAALVSSDELMSANLALNSGPSSGELVS
jgi:DNA-binding GntR family transcriptional regulator